MELETVLYRVEGPVAVISLNRTKAMNSLNKQIFADLTTAFNAAKDDVAVRCVVMNGEGRAFCVGGDIAEMKTINTEPAFFDFMTVAGEFTTLLNTFPKPVIAAAHGAIAGAGTSLVMGADIALVADNAMFIVAFGQVGTCGICVDACEYEALSYGDERHPVVDAAKCNGCGECERICPANVLTSFGGGHRRGINIVTNKTFEEGRA